MPFPPGAGTDATARIVAETLGEVLHQTVIVDNVAGANGLLGTKAVAVRRRSAGVPLAVVARPLLRGAAFGLTNPKGYPVAVATFTALLAGHAAELDWRALPPLLARCV